MWRKDEWPVAEGWYWFFGRSVCEARFGRERSLSVAKVRQCANGVAAAVNNNLIWESELERPYWFMLIEPPVPPGSDNGDQA